MRTTAVVLALLLAPPAPLRAAEFFVAPNGDDAKSGSKDQPFATLHQAQIAARQARLQGQSLPRGALAFQAACGPGLYWMTLSASWRIRAHAVVRPLRWTAFVEIRPLMRRICFPNSGTPHLSR